MEQSLARAEVPPGFPNFAPRRANQAAAPAVRHNVYAIPHKALRLWFSSALSAAGRVDPHDDVEIAALTEQIRGLLQFCRMHLEKEDEFVHPAMEARRRGSSHETQDDHHEHIAAQERLECGVQALAMTNGAQREIAVTQLYRQLALFVADNLVHMHAEETDNNEVLWAAYGDDELQALEQRITASIPQDVKQKGLRWIVPAMNPVERAAFLRGIRASMPPMAFNGMLAGLQSHLSDAERHKLSLALAN